MKKIILLFGLCIVCLGIFIYIFRPEASLPTNPSNTVEHDANQTNQTALNDDQESFIPKTNDRDTQIQAKKTKKLSEEAIQYYRTATKYGWESIVRDFENGTILKSKMSQEEKDKLCEIALSLSTADQTKRLFKANCKPLNGQSSFMIINAKLTNAEGEIDQNEIIEKLKFYKSENVLQTKVTYKFGPYEEKSSLQSNAIGWGLEDVSDYLLSIGVDYTGVDGNLILDNIKGRNPSVSLVQKLLNAGIEPNSNVYKQIEQNDFSTKYPNIYNLLKAHKP
ncbi:hypothetical protein [Acinetobacter sp. YH12069]|uniref:hypothetical protein n=1 Tax=Acinetobacter sp. YH12069 TaxID=2601065 RepID=UPI0015D2EC6B|nr:hypothetical protein [Acinetobacter sp. YH12069]